MDKLEIIFENEDLIAINKPHGLLVHRTSLARDANTFALQILRDQTGQKLYPVHRLDRKTSGVLLFAKNSKANKSIQALFRGRLINKQYIALVRGFTPSEGIIDYALKKDDKIQPAVTMYKRKRQFEIPIPSSKFPTSRYSLLELFPETGRYHQLRKHMAHIFHPIIGDRPHGCNKQNKMWKEKFNMTTMLLHATSLTFSYPSTRTIQISADLNAEFLRALKILENFST